MIHLRNFCFSIFWFYSAFCWVLLKCDMKSFSHDRKSFPPEITRTNIDLYKKYLKFRQLRSHSSIRPNELKYSFSKTFGRPWTFPPIWVFDAVEVFCKLLADFPIQSFRRVLWWILLHWIWLYIWWVAKSFHTVKRNTLNMICLQKSLYEE